MTGGVLQRLVDQATGTATPGLRPRLPARFETAAPDPGLHEIHHEVPAPSTPTPQPPDPAMVTRRQDDEGPVRPPPESLQPPAAMAEPAPPPTHARPEPDLTPPKAHPAPLAPPPPPLLPQAPAARMAMWTPPAAPPPRVETVSAEDPRPASPPPRRRQTAPEPLLPPAEPLPSTILERETPEHPARSADATQPDELPAASAPEITIHIGRLDIRAEAPKPARPQRQVTTRPSMPTLADYLRGSGS
jgi:hypothetical protein